MTTLLLELSPSCNAMAPDGLKSRRGHVTAHVHMKNVLGFIYQICVHNAALNLYQFFKSAILNQPRLFGAGQM